MRNTDINRVARAKEHMTAALTILGNIKWENIQEGKEEWDYKTICEWIGNCERFLDTWVKQLRDEEGGRS